MEAKSANECAYTGTAIGCMAAILKYLFESPDAGLEVRRCGISAEQVKKLSVEVGVA